MITDPEVRAVVEDHLPDHGLTRTQQRAADQLLHAARVPATEAARLLGVTDRTIHRWRKADSHQAEGPRCPCGKPLTKPESIARGYGATCWRRLKRRATRRGRAPERPIDLAALEANGQTAIPVQISLETR